MPCTLSTAQRLGVYRSSLGPSALNELHPSLLRVISCPLAFNITDHTDVSRLRKVYDPPRALPTATPVIKLSSMCDPNSQGTRYTVHLIPQERLSLLIGLLPEISEGSLRERPRIRVPSATQLALRGVLRASTSLLGQTFPLPPDPNTRS